MGEPFGRYEILRKVASGGMAEVFLAKHSGLGGFERLVCIKRILQHLGEQEDFVRMFQDEARIAANLIHPNIAQIYDIGEVDGAYYIAMEYVRGEDLRRIYNQEVARGRAIPAEQAAHAIMGAAAALDYAHRQSSLDGRPLGIVHRDISPQNILVTYDGHVKLVDFGVAKAAGKLAETKSGVLKGKYSYMSPEQASGDPIDGRTDIFALGITLYEITVGMRLFKRDSEIETLHAVIACDVTPPSQAMAQYPEELERIVLRALKLDVDERYATAGELERDLERFLVGRQHAISPSALGEYMHELFADKIADDLLFAGQPWQEPLTPSRPPNQTRKIEPQDQEVTMLDETRKRDTPSISAKSRPSRPSRPAGVDTWVSASHTASETDTQLGRVVSAQKETKSETVVEATPLKPPRRIGAGAPVLWATGCALLIGGLWLGFSGDGPVAHTASFTVDSEPRGAQVMFLGPESAPLNELYGALGTPFRVDSGLPVVEGLRARFAKQGYESKEVALAELSPQKVPTVFAELVATAVQPQGRLVFVSTPAGATVLVDGQILPGVTPVYDLAATAGRMHIVELRLDGHAPRSENVYVEPGARKVVELTLLPVAAQSGAGEATQPAEEVEPKGKAVGASAKGFLGVDSPMILQVRIGRRSLGTTPTGKLPMASGEHMVELYSPEEGFTLRRRVRISGGSFERLVVDPKHGTLAVNAVPWAKVVIGRHGGLDTPLTRKLFEGEYTIVFECPDGSTRQERAVVRPDATTAVSVDCQG